jgi:hypothetical protein
MRAMAFGPSNDPGKLQISLAVCPYSIQWRRSCLPNRYAASGGKTGRSSERAAWTFLREWA